MTRFTGKAETFSSFYAKQCSLTNIDSFLQSGIINKTGRPFYSVRFSTEGILQIIKNLDSNKALWSRCDYNVENITMLKRCGSSAFRPLQIIYKSCLDWIKFPQEQKISNVIPVHEKNDKQLAKNYRSISLLPICGKIF